MIEAALDHAFEYFASCSIVLFSYVWAKLFLSIRIEERGNYHTIKDKILSFLLAIAGSAIVATIIGFMFHSKKSAITAFAVFIVVSIVALIKLYGNFKKDD